MKKMLSVVIVSFTLAMFLISPTAAKTTFKLATVTPDHHAYSVGAKEFARLVKEGTKGEIEIRVYPGGQLGSGEREFLEGLQVGTLDMCITATGPLSNFSESMGVVDLPFLFKSAQAVDNILDGAIGRKLLDDLESANIKGLSFFENGFRNFTNSKRELVTPADFKGLKFRTMENPVHLASVRQLGAQAVPMSWGEVYTSLQTSVIDGQENPVAIIHSFKLNEVQKYLSLSGHFYSPAPLTMSLKKFNKLSKAHQQVILESAAKAAAYERKLVRDNENRQVEELKKSGMQVTKVDKAIFIEAMKPIYEQFGKKYPTWEAIIKKIQATQ